MKEIMHWIDGCAAVKHGPDAEAIAAAALWWHERHPRVVATSSRRAAAGVVLTTRVSERLRWAVEVLGLAPNDQVLEIGCGPGAAVSLVCEQLVGGRITAIDRSATAIKRAAKRNAEHVGSGKAVLRHVDLAAFGLPGQRFDKVFAVNVSTFWVRASDAEWLVVKEHLRRDGVLHLFYETPGTRRASQVADAVTAALTSHGFSSTTTYSTSPSLICISGRVLG
jgi:cyclopropane fatty-acyl-phospholipid synthase-like methyltransferase